jgi:hypothetical protein
MHDEEGNEEEKGPLGEQGNLEGLSELTEWCRTIMGSGTIEEFAREVVRRNAEMVAGWQVSRSQAVRPSSRQASADWAQISWRGH